MANRWINTTPDQRFDAKVEVMGDCWMWRSWIGGYGYGKFRLNGKTISAHRYAYMRRHGSVPSGLILDHLCRNRACVNPDHLEPVTNRVNVLRGNGTSAINSRRTHCVKGHAFDATNTRIDPRGRRNCRTCCREWAREQRRKVRLGLDAAKEKP